MIPAPPDSLEARREQLAAAVRSAAEAGPPDAASWRPVSVTTAAGQIDRTAVAFNVFKHLLASDGVREALYSLLRLTDYRFIGIFRFKDGKATSAVHVDRANLHILQAQEVPDTATYCCYVRSAAGPFVTADAMLDSRTASHAAREAVRAYCGLPILTPEGELVGTLCHYDLVPRDPQQLDFELLLWVASALSAPGIVPPYPDLAAP